VTARWLFELDVEDARGFKRRELELGEGEAMTLGGADSVLRSQQAQVALEVRPDGVLAARALVPEATLDGVGFEAVTPRAGQVFAVQGATATVRVPPHFKGQAAGPACKRWQLKLEGAGEGRAHEVTLTKPTGLMFTFGRVDLNALRLPIESLARRHVGLFVDASGQLWAKDLGSPPGTWLGALRLDRWAPLPEGAVLRAGQATLAASVPVAA
jgi:hypothetical protein